MDRAYDRTKMAARDFFSAGKSGYGYCQGIDEGCYGIGTRCRSRRLESLLKSEKTTPAI